MIKSCGQALEVFIDRFTSFGSVFDLLFKLLNMTTARFSIRLVESGPDLCSSLRSGENGLKRVGDGTEKRTEDEAVLSSPDRVLRVHNRDIVHRDRWWRWVDRSIEMRREVITVEECRDLTTPHQEVGGGELRHVGHVDVEKSLILRNNDCFTGRSRRRRHSGKFLKKRGRRLKKNFRVRYRKALIPCNEGT